jgi:lysyl-tRNA synthetase class 1
MLWTEDVVNAIDINRLQIINDSKTPSGEAHVGSLRGLLIHDALFKILQVKGIAGKYIFGSDDYDPLDELPKENNEFFEKYLGMPLCNVPPPVGSKFPDMAEHYFSGFSGVFHTLDVNAEIYRMRDVYRSGRFNEAIHRILCKSDCIREIYKRVSGSQKSSKWFPFQAICESCGRIGTTEVIDYDGREVTYICRPNMVKWAKGCGHTGKVSPFDGNGKLPWKLEWVAKWMVFGITIEGAGADHNTKGGSRDVAVSVLKGVFDLDPPLNVPYGFFLVEGSKMSSSKGIGVTAREMSKLLSPEILRYLMLSTPPKRAINFSPTEDFIVKLHNDFDSIRETAFSNVKENGLQKELIVITDKDYDQYFKLPGFSLVKGLVQMPHIDIFKAAMAIKGNVLTDLEKMRLGGRIETARCWIANYATEDDKFQIQDKFPEEQRISLNTIELGFFKRFESDLRNCEWSESALQHQVFNSSRLTPIAAADGCKALYKIFLNKNGGPQIGRLLFYLGKEFVFRRLSEIDLDILELWKSGSIEPLEFEHAIAKERDKFVTSSANPQFISNRVGSSRCGDFITGAGVLELEIKKTDNYWHMYRIILCHFIGFCDPEKEYAEFRICLEEFRTGIEETFNFQLGFSS